MENLLVKLLLGHRVDHALNKRSIWKTLVTLSVRGKTNLGVDEVGHIEHSIGVSMQVNHKINSKVPHNPEVTTLGHKSPTHNSEHESKWFFEKSCLGYLFIELEGSIGVDMERSKSRLVHGVARGRVGMNTIKAITMRKIKEVGKLRKSEGVPLPIGHPFNRP